MIQSYWDIYELHILKFILILALSLLNKNYFSRFFHNHQKCIYMIKHSEFLFARAETSVGGW